MRARGRHWPWVTVQEVVQTQQKSPQIGALDAALQRTLQKHLPRNCIRPIIDRRGRDVRAFPTLLQYLGLVPVYLRLSSERNKEELMQENPAVDFVLCL